MKTFVDVERMRVALQVFSKQHPGAAGRKEFERFAVEHLELTLAQAEIYAAVLLSRNLDDSPDSAATNAYDLLGTWQRMHQTGNPSGWMRTVTETWDFRDNLTYEHTVESYTGAVASSPIFQGSYSHPTSNVDGGNWAPSDLVQPGRISLALISRTAAPKRVKCDWAGPDGEPQSKISILGSTFLKQ